MSVMRFRRLAPTIRGHDVATVAAGDFLVPAIRDGRANEEPHQTSREPIEDHDDCNAVGRIAVPFLYENSQIQIQIQIQNRQLRQQDREKVEKLFREDELEPDHEFTLCYGNNMAASMTVLDKDWRATISKMMLYKRLRVDEPLVNERL